jgi:hypothetical protein
MKKIIIITGILFLIGSPVFGQNVLVNNSIKIGEIFTPLNCYYPQIAQLTPLQVTTISDTAGLEFCVDGNYDLAISYQYMVSLDGMPYTAVTVQCQKGFNPTICTFGFNADQILALQIKGTHNIGVQAIQNNNLLWIQYLATRRPYCQDSGNIYEVGDPLPVTITGALRNQQGTFTFESQIGKLRSEGFKIEWQRVQFGLDSDGKNGYWYMLGWCEGK